MFLYIIHLIFICQCEIHRIIFWHIDMIEGPLVLQAKYEPPPPPPNDTKK